MKDEKIAKLVEGAKTDKRLLNNLIQMFQPLINSYCKKLFFMESDDAKQEMYLAIMESVQSISKCSTDGQCIMYISNAVKFKYAFLCKKNIAKKNQEDLYITEMEETIYYDENYRMVELRCDYENVFSTLPARQKTILLYMINGYSDRQIADLLGISRQYVNRIKRMAKKRICGQ